MKSERDEIYRKLILSAPQRPVKLCTTFDGVEYATTSELQALRHRSPAVELTWEQSYRDGDGSACHGIRQGRRNIFVALQKSHKMPHKARFHGARDARARLPQRVHVAANAARPQWLPTSVLFSGRPPTTRRTRRVFLAARRRRARVRRQWEAVRRRRSSNR